VSELEAKVSPNSVLSFHFSLFFHHFHSGLKGIDEVLVVCINDAAVMDAWADDQKVGRDGSGSMINFLGDPHGNLIDALDMRMTAEGPHGKFGQGRSKRFSAYFDKGVLKIMNVAEAPDDPAGDDRPGNSLVEKMLTDLTTLGLKGDL
tara:strand:- start:1639 stop:2082 length:444 start_codon:yes stop_codon:yes gene_type:complete